MNRCINCEYVRKAKAGLPHIACSYWSKKQLVDGMNEKDKIKEMVKTLRSGNIFEGWALLGQRPGNKNDTSAFGSGMMTNSCTLLKEDNCCGEFKRRRK